MRRFGRWRTRDRGSGFRQVDLAEFDGWEPSRQRSVLESYGRERAKMLAEYRRLVDHLRLRARRDPEIRPLYDRAVRHLRSGELTQTDVVHIAGVFERPVVQADSFWESLVGRRRKKQLGLVPERHLGRTKDKDRLFAELLGLPMPAQHFAGRFDDIPDDLRENVVVKPFGAAEGKGAFFVFSPNEIFSIFTSERFSGWGEMSREIASQLGVASPSDVEWQVQELVTEGHLPARDLKFYCFYGRIGLIVEVSRYPTRQYAYFNEDGSEADCGKTHMPRFEDPTLTITDKGGIGPEKLQTVRWISEQIPVPFMRIDFLNTGSGMLFCEFSSAPGESHTLSTAYDRRLGRFYHRAEIRLVNDLLAGKEFTAFHEFSRLRSTAGGDAGS